MNTKFSRERLRLQRDVTVVRDELVGLQERQQLGE